MLRQVFSLLLIGLLFIFATTSCTNNPSIVRDFPPQLPSEGSMEIDFSDFIKQKSSSQSAPISVNNFARATFTAGMMKAVVEANLVIPKALLAAAADSSPKINKKGQWEWRYSAFVGGRSYAARLVASSDDKDSINWKFFVSNQQRGLDDRLLFSGAINAAGSHGSWTFFNPQNAGFQEEVLKTEWAIKSKKEVRLKIEVASDRFEREGDSIDYTFNGTLKSVVYYDAGKKQTTEVQWNADTNVGYVFSPDYNKGHQACWDESFADIACREL